MVRGDRDDLTEGAVREQAADLRDVRKESSPHRLHQEELRRTSGAHQFLGLGGIHRERLLHEHRFARLQREERVGVMHGMRSRDVHNVDVRVRDQGLVTSVSVGNVEPIGEAVGRIQRAGRA